MRAVIASALAVAIALLTVSLSAAQTSPWARQSPLRAAARGATFAANLAALRRERATFVGQANRLRGAAVRPLRAPAQTADQLGLPASDFAPATVDHTGFIDPSNLVFSGLHPGGYAGIKTGAGEEAVLDSGYIWYQGSVFDNSPDATAAYADGIATVNGAAPFAPQTCPNIIELCEINGFQAQNGNLDTYEAALVSNCEVEVETSNPSNMSSSDISSLLSAAATAFVDSIHRAEGICTGTYHAPATAAPTDTPTPTPTATATPAPTEAVAVAPQPFSLHQSGHGTWRSASLALTGHVTINWSFSCGSTKRLFKLLGYQTGLVASPLTFAKKRAKNGSGHHSLTDPAPFELAVKTSTACHWKVGVTGETT